MLTISDDFECTCMVLNWQFWRNKILMAVHRKRYNFIAIVVDMNCGGFYKGVKII